MNEQQYKRAHEIQEEISVVALSITHAQSALEKVKQKCIPTISHRVCLKIDDAPDFPINTVDFLEALVTGFIAQQKERRKKLEEEFKSL